MSENTKLSWEQIEIDCRELANKIGPCDVIVAIGRGGLAPGVILSHFLDAPIFNFGIKSYKDKEAGEPIITQIPGLKFNSNYRDKRVIIFDDLSDKGSTLIYAKEYFELNEFINFKFATLYIKDSTKFIPNFYIKNFDDKIWLDFPWETATIV